MKIKKLYEEQEEDDILDDIDFYELCNIYRHMPLGNQKKTTEAFEDIKKFIRENFLPKNEEIVKRWLIEKDANKYNI